MNAKDVKALLEPVPSEDFIVGIFTDEESKCCAIGHLMRLTSKDPNDYSNRNCEDGLADPSKMDTPMHVFNRVTTAEFLKDVHNIRGVDISYINNGPEFNGYDQEGPKERVMQLLDDMIEAGY